MAFLDELKRAGTGASSIYGAVRPDLDNHLNDIMYMRKQAQEEDLNNFKNKTNFLSDLSQRMNPMQRIFNPENDPNNSQPPRNGLAGIGAPAVGNAQNTIFREDPDRITPFQQAGIGIRQQEIGVDKSRLAQQGKLGEEAIGVRRAQEGLNQQKSDQIKEQKQNELQAKIEASDNALKLAHDKLQQNQNDALAHAEFNKAAMASKDARHQLDLAQRDKQIEELKNYREAQLASKNKPTEEETQTKNPDGTVKVVKKKKGPASEDDNDPGGFRK